MPVRTFVIDRHPAVEQGGHCFGIKRVFDCNCKQRLRLIEQEAAITIGAVDESSACFGGDWQSFGFHSLGAGQQGLKRFIVKPARAQAPAPGSGARR